MWKIKLIRWSFLLVAVGGLAVCLWLSISSVWLLAYGERAIGVVRSLEEREDISHSGSESFVFEQESYAPVVVFTTSDGTEVVFATEASGSEDAFAIGAEVPVLYSASKPELARLKTFEHLFGGALMALGMAVGFALFAGLTTLADFVYGDRDEATTPGRGT